MRIAFCVNDFPKEMLTFQPWLTFLHIGKRMIQQGHEMYVVIDVTHPAIIENFITYRVKSLRGSNKCELITGINANFPDTLVFLPTPLNLITSDWLGAMPNCRCVAFTAYPFYTVEEPLNTWKKGKFKHI